MGAGKEGGETGAAGSKAARAAPAHAAPEQQQQQSTSSGSCACCTCASVSENPALFRATYPHQLASSARRSSTCAGYMSVGPFPASAARAKKSPAAPYSRALTAIWAKNGHFAFRFRCAPPVLAVVVPGYFECARAPSERPLRGSW